MSSGDHLLLSPDSCHFHPSKPQSYFRVGSRIHPLEVRKRECSFQEQSISSNRGISHDMGLVINTWEEEISKNTFWNQAPALSHRTKPVDVGWGNWKSWRQVFAVTGQVTRSDWIWDGSTENCVPLRSSNMSRLAISVASCCRNFVYNLIASHLRKPILRNIDLKLAQPGHGPLFFIHESWQLCKL